MIAATMNHTVSIKARDESRSFDQGILLRRNFVFHDPVLVLNGSRFGMVRKAQNMKVNEEGNVLFSVGLFIV